MGFPKGPMWGRLLHEILTKAIRHGRLTVTFPDGHLESYGSADGPQARVALGDPDLMRRIVLNPQMALGEGYMDGHLTFPSDNDMRHFLQFAALSAQGKSLPLVMRAANRLRVRTKGLMQANTALKARQRVAHHYDIPDEFYGLFMEEDLQYTCAYFREVSATLEQAPIATMEHIAAKLCLRPGLRVLDIGCGWGGLALRLARLRDVHVTGITLSQVQLDAAQRRTAQLGLSHRVEFRLQDYRQILDRFDRVVSVGLMEHVGVLYYQTYFDKIQNILTPDGVALIHFIGRSTPPGVLSPWFEKYILTGGDSSALSEVVPRVERAGLVRCDR